MFYFTSLVALWSMYSRGIQQSALYFTIIYYKKSFISLPKLDTKLENVKFILVAIVLNLHTFFTKTFFLLVEKYRYQNVCVEFYTSVHIFWTFPHMLLYYCFKLILLTSFERYWVTDGDFCPSRYFSQPMTPTSSPVGDIFKSHASTVIDMK